MVKKIAKKAGDVTKRVYRGGDKPVFDCITSGGDRSAVNFKTLKQYSSGDMNFLFTSHTLSFSYPTGYQDAKVVKKVFTNEKWNKDFNTICIALDDISADNVRYFEEKFKEIIASEVAAGKLGGETVSEFKSALYVDQDGATSLRLTPSPTKGASLICFDYTDLTEPWTIPAKQPTTLSWNEITEEHRANVNFVCHGGYYARNYFGLTFRPSSASVFSSASSE